MLPVTGRFLSRFPRISGAELNFEVPSPHPCPIHAATQRSSFPVKPNPWGPLSPLSFTSANPESEAVGQSRCQVCTVRVNGGLPVGVCQSTTKPVAMAVTHVTHSRRARETRWKNGIVRSEISIRSPTRRLGSPLGCRGSSIPVESGGRSTNAIPEAASRPAARARACRHTSSTEASALSHASTHGHSTRARLFTALCTCTWTHTKLA
jgi:hypothetical protein